MTAKKNANALFRAKKMGREAAAAGKSKTDCPYSRRGAAGNYRAAWMEGFTADELVSLYRLDAGELSILSVRRGVAKDMNLCDWAALATRDGDDIDVEVIHGSRDATHNGCRLVDLVRGDMQD